MAYAGVARHAALYRERVPTGRGWGWGVVFHVKHAIPAWHIWIGYLGDILLEGIWYLRPPGLFPTAA